MTSAHGESAREYPDRWSPGRKTALAVFLWPVVIVGVGILWYLSFMDQLPQQVATHWSRSGPDGFTARESVPWLGLFGLVMSWFTGGVVLAVGGLAGSGHGDGTHRRISVGITAGTAAFVTGVMVLTAWDQRGLADGSLARDAEWPLVMSLLASLAVGGLAAFTVPGRRATDARATRPVPASSPRAELAGDQRAAWSRLAAPARWFWIFAALVTAVILGSGFLTGAWVFTTLMLVLTVGVMLALSVFRVTVGQPGLVVTGIVGVPRWRLPLEDVAEARVTTVDPLAEFGGWGYRLGMHGRTGFVVRKGPALEVERGDGTAWVVTVDGPEEGAALLNTLAERARA